MSRPGFHNAFARLALAAMLLLALLPTAGRMGGLSEHGGHAGHEMASLDAPHAMPMPMAMHAMHGHAMPDAPHAPTRKAPAAPTHADCDYCPLLAGLVALALPIALPPATRQPLPDLPAVRTPALRTPLVPGLGARGPPTFRA